MLKSDQSYYHKEHSLKISIYIIAITTLLLGDITIKDAWRRVEKVSNSLQASQDDLKRSQLKKESAESINYPSISVTASYTRLNAPIGIDVSNISSVINPIISSIGGKTIPSQIDFLGRDVALADLQLLYPLYTGGKIDAAQDAYSAKVDEAVATQRLERDKAFLKLIKLYYGVVMMESLYETNVEAQKALQLHYYYAKKLKEQGQIAQVELLNAKVKLDTAKIETTKSKHQLEIVKLALYDLIKLKEQPKSPLFVSSKVLNKNLYSNRALGSYAGIELLDAKSKQASAMVDVEKSAWYPQVVGYANANLYKGNSPLEEMAPEWMVGVSMKFDIFAKKDRSKEIEAAKLLHSKVESLKAQAQDDLKLGIEKTYNEMKLYRDEYNSLSSSIQLAQENYKLRSISFREGLSTSVEVVDAQLFLSGAKTKRLNAAYNYIKKLAFLSVLSGDRDSFFKFERLSRGIR